MKRKQCECLICNEVEVWCDGIGEFLHGVRNRFGTAQKGRGEGFFRIYRRYIFVRECSVDAEGSGLSVQPRKSREGKQKVSLYTNDIKFSAA